jgi:hypothetical protein
MVFGVLKAPWTEPSFVKIPVGFEEILKIWCPTGFQISIKI